MQSSARNSATAWQMAVALLVLASMAGMAATMVLAARRVGPVADANYYDNGLHYGRTSSGSANPGMGWTMTASLAGDELQVRVRDQSGAPISGGELRFETGGSGAVPSGALLLAESTPGTFAAPRPASPQGELHGTLRFTRGEAAASQKLVLFN